MRSSGFAFLLSLVGMFCCEAARAQLAPGPLSRAHADLDGVTMCGSCHDFGAHRLKCLECHSEIRRRVDEKRGLHARSYKFTPGETDCARCHAEHRGSRFALVPLDRKVFDHGSQTGFTLEGKHREQKCENCHSAQKIAAAARAEIKMKDPGRSFLGLRRECAGCHQDPHRNQLGADCLNCHKPDGWKPAPKFNHSKAAFPLTGEHQQVQCEKCHSRPPAGTPGGIQAGTAAAEGEPAVKVRLFKGLLFAGCQDCHKDQHRGAFQEVKLSGKCDTCHDTGGWKNNRPARGFDHSLTKFRLAGKHAGVTCGKCHKESDFSRPISHELCRNCHEDPHKGQFANRAAGSDCSSCHSPVGFKPGLFDRAAHARSAFPLVGKHAALACAKCHQPEGREARYKTGKLLCPACHAEPHGGEFAAAPHSNQCGLCHTDAGFETTTYSRERHAQTRFPLTGKHADVECHKCHKPLSPAGQGAVTGLTDAQAGARALAARRQYHFASRACASCHADPHRIDPLANLSCETCHTPQEWKSPLPFDHSRTRFRLEGEHQSAARPIPCTGCHKPAAKAEGAAAAAAPVFARISPRCANCHAAKDPHSGQFNATESRQTDCSSCHTPLAWTAGGFNHSATRFALDSSHRELACTRCHKEHIGANGKIIRAYRDTPLECLKCHSAP